MDRGDGRLLRVTSPHFCAGVEAGTRWPRSARAAPIIKYFKGWSESAIRAYCKRKGWKVEIVS